jgi:hypothetical protein
MTLHDRSDTTLPDTAPDSSDHRAIRMDEPAPRGRGSGAVVITVKRRKTWAGQAAESPAGRDGHGALTLLSKAPRVFRIDAEGADGPEGADGAGPSGTMPQAPALVDASADSSGAVTSKASRHRRPRNPDRAPGKVTTVVQPSPAPASQPDRAAAERAIPFSFDVDVEGYARVMDALQAVQATLQQARRARDFRILQPR